MAPRTSPAELEQEGLDALADTLRYATGSLARSVKIRPSKDIDILLTLADGRKMIGEVKAAAHADPARIADAVPNWKRELKALRDTAGDRGAEGGTAFGVLVADSVPDATRVILRDAGWGWLDRRGSLFLQAPGLLVNDTSVEPHPRRGHAPQPTSPIRGRAGLMTATALLIDPDEPHGVRQIARNSTLAPSTVSSSLNALRASALVDAKGRPLIPELFWALADAWSPDRVALASAPSPGRSSRLEVNLHHLDRPGWALSGTIAASAWGAPVPVQSGYPPDFYVPSTRHLREASRRLGVTTDWQQRGCTATVAPLNQVVVPRYDAESLSTPWLEWPLTHPLFVALDLARDRSRGVEILADWTPPAGFRRVW